MTSRRLSAVATLDLAVGQTSFSPIPECPELLIIYLLATQKATCLVSVVKYLWLVCSRLLNINQVCVQEERIPRCYLLSGEDNRCHVFWLVITQVRVYGHVPSDLLTSIYKGIKNWHRLLKAEVSLSGCALYYEIMCYWCVGYRHSVGAVNSLVFTLFLSF